MIKRKYDLSELKQDPIDRCATYCRHRQRE